MTVTFYTRQGCGLCALALPTVEEVCAGRGHRLEIIDVDAADLAREYGERVPVVLRDGAEVLWGRFGAEEIRRALG